MCNNMKEGNIIFLTRAKGSWWNWRVVLTWITASLSTREISKVDTVLNHTAIIFRKENQLFVRDMDVKGNSTIELFDYFKLYKGRITIKQSPFKFDKTRLEYFNTECYYNEADYDYFNLLFFQLIKTFFGFFIGKNTIRHRTCSEDVARMFNVLKSNYFKKPEQITPGEIDKFTNDWITILKA